MGVRFCVIERPYTEAQVEADKRFGPWCTSFRASTGIRNRVRRHSLENTNFLLTEHGTRDVLPTVSVLPTTSVIVTVVADTEADAGSTAFVISDSVRKQGEASYAA